MTSDAVRYDALMRASALLTPEETTHLLHVVHNDPDPKRVSRAEGILVGANRRFVFQAAMRFGRVGTPIFDDIFIAGCAGLLRAIREYDDTKGVGLLTYAVWWIRQHITVELRDQNSLISGLTSGRERLRRTKAEIKRLKDAGSDVPEELQAQLDDLERIVNTTKISLDKQLPDGRPVIDIQDESAITDMFDAVDATRTNQRLLCRLVGHLEPKQCAVLELYFGVGTETAMTFEEISAALVRKGLTETPLSKERIRQIKVKALQGLRQHAKLLGFDSQSFYAAE